MRAWLLVAAIACACACACASSAPARPMPKPAVDPGPLRAPDALPFDFQWNQRVTATWPTGKRTFDAVLQKRAGELMLVGLSPMGLPGFILRLDSGAKITVENRTGRELPFAPEYILADVQRVFFPWLPQGVSSGDVGPVHVVEQRTGEQLLRRTFTRTDGAAKGEVRVVYAPRRSGEDASRRVEVDNAWFGYALLIETLEQSRL
jgi:hypothetical protein